ncbi:putative sugar phosphate isomerase YwlF [bioreactor metagenome]|uniref:Putative sugar phosphate isomerase YwlF n=1 Tax=bioreactor metagenome TaxID=1076179 RepID=A0A645GB33_9ZZZZ
MKLAIGSDHGGFELKTLIIAYLKDLGHDVQDFGCYSTDSADYPAVAIPLSEAVAAGKFEKGILICGTGIGMSIAANKVRGVRCALCSESLSARLTREHNDTNVLAMGARMIGPEMEKEIVKVWLGTDFIGKHHSKRIQMISDFENK